MLSVGILVLDGLFVAGVQTLAACQRGQPQALVSVDDVAGGHRLGIRNIDGLAPPEIARPFINHVHWTDIDAISAGRAERFINTAGPLPDRNVEVADVPGYLRDFRIGDEPNIFMLARVGHLWTQDADGAIHGGKGFVDECHHAADGGALFHQDHLVAVVGKIQRRLYAGHTAADHQSALGDRDLQLGHRPEELGLGNSHLQQIKSLLRAGRLFVKMHPAALLADVGHLHHRRVQSAASEHLLPGGAVQSR